MYTEKWNYTVINFALFSVRLCDGSRDNVRNSTTSVCGERLPKKIVFLYQKFARWPVHFAVTFFYVIDLSMAYSRKLFGRHIYTEWG